jgi:hypothetical protein
MHRVGRCLPPPPRPVRRRRRRGRGSAGGRAGAAGHTKGRAALLAHPTYDDARQDRACEIHRVAGVAAAVAKRPLDEPACATAPARPACSLALQGSMAWSGERGPARGGRHRLGTARERPGAAPFAAHMQHADVKPRPKLRRAPARVDANSLPRWCRSPQRPELPTATTSARRAGGAPPRPLHPAPPRAARRKHGAAGLHALRGTLGSTAAHPLARVGENALLVLWGYGVVRPNSILMGAVVAGRACLARGGARGRAGRCAAPGLAGCEFPSPQFNVGARCWALARLSSPFEPGRPVGGRGLNKRPGRR